MRLFSTLITALLFQYQIEWGHSHNLPQKIRVGYIYVPSRDGLNESSIAVISLAEQELKEAQILPIDVSFDVEYEYGVCDDYNASLAYVRLVEHQNISVLFGPPCSQSGDVIARLAVSYNMLLISHVLYSDTFENKQLYQTCARTTIKSVSQIASALISLLEMYEWRRVALIFAEDFYSAILVHGVRKELKLHNIFIAADVSYEDMLRDEEQSLASLKNKAKVIIPILTWKMGGSLEFMQHVHRHNMTGPDYVWLLLELDYEEANILPWEFISQENDKKIKKENLAIKDAYRPVIMIHAAADHEQISHIEKYKIEYTRIFPDRSAEDFHVTDLQAQLYDSVFTYGVLLNESDSAGISFTDGLGLFNLLKCKRIEKYDHSHIIFDGDVERVPRYHFHAFNQQNKWSLMYLGERARDNESEKYKHVLIPKERFYWRTNGNTPPKDTPPCGFDGMLCKTIATEMGIGVCVALLVMVLAAIAYGYRKKMRADFMKMAWHIDPENIVMEKFGDESTKTLSGLKRSLQSLQSTRALSVLSSTDSMTMKQTRVGIYDANRVGIFSYKRMKRINLNKEQLDKLVYLKRISHENLAAFCGMSLNESNKVVILWQYTSSRSLRDVLSNEEINLDNDFLATFLRGISTGLKYIHRSQIHFHGNLTSEKCLVDNRFVIKITDHGIDTLLGQLVHLGCIEKHYETYDMLHAAPEQVQSMLQNKSTLGSKPADIYSVALIFYQIVTRRELYIDQIETGDIPILELLKQIETPAMFPVRPTIPDNVSHIWMGIINLIRKCWDHDPNDRPNIDTVSRTVNQATEQFSKNVIEDMIKRMEKYTSNLEKVVNERTEQVQAQQERAEKLLQQMLPKSVADRLQAGLTVEPEWYAACTILFTDIVQFTSLSAKHSPLEMVTLLNGLYSAFDELIDTHNVYKVETIGDAYMVVSGVPNRHQNHAEQIILLAIDLRNFVQSFQLPFTDDSMTSLKIRLGCHSGPVATGVVGLKMPRFCLFGDSVNTASRMESNGIPMKIHVTTETKHELDGNKMFIVETRGNIEIKV